MGADSRMRFGGGQGAMAARRHALFATIALLSGLAALPAARAEDASPSEASADLKLTPPSDPVVRHLDKIDAVPPADTSASDVGARVDELEATRADMDRKSGPPISLSVSGWALGQVSTHH